MDGAKTEHELRFKLFYNAPENNLVTEVFNCTLMGLWKDDNERETADLIKCWGLHKEGDYLQQTISRKPEIKILTDISLTAVFHEIIRNKRENFNFINNIYSTSEIAYFSFGYSLFSMGKRFWEKQHERGLALWIESESRYKAIL